MRDDITMSRRPSLAGHMHKIILVSAFYISYENIIFNTIVTYLVELHRVKYSSLDIFLDIV